MQLGKFPITVAITGLLIGAGLLAQFPKPQGNNGGGSPAPAGDTFGCEPTLASNVATINSNCKGWYGSSFISLSATGTLSGPGGTGTVYAYLKNSALFFGLYSSTGTCANATCETILSDEFPEGVVQIAAWDNSGGTLSNMVDYRTPQRSQPISGGTDIGVVGDGNGGLTINYTGSPTAGFTKFTSYDPAGSSADCPVAETWQNVPQSVTLTSVGSTGYLEYEINMERTAGSNNWEMRVLLDGNDLHNAGGAGAGLTVSEGNAVLRGKVSLASASVQFVTIQQFRAGSVSSMYRHAKFGFTIASSAVLQPQIRCKTTPGDDFRASTIVAFLY